MPAQSGNGQSSSERSIVVDDLAALNASLAQATASRIEAQARYQQSGRAGASAEALSNSAINSLRQRRAELAAEYRRSEEHTSELKSLMRISYAVFCWNTNT